MGSEMCIRDRENTVLGLGSDFILLGLLDGRIYLEFNNIGGLHSLSTTVSSSRRYNDGEAHQLSFTFNRGQFQLLLDSTDNIQVESKVSMASCMTDR